MNVLVVLAVFAALCVAYGRLLEHVALRGLTCTRAFSRREVFEGDEGELVEVISNDRPLIVPWLRVESRISRHLQFGRQENLDVSGSMYHKSLFTLMPYQRITRRHRVNSSASARLPSPRRTMRWASTGTASSLTSSGMA